MRERERGEWFFHWRDGVLYAIPEVAAPARSYGTPQTLEATDHRHLGLLAARLHELRDGETRVSLFVSLSTKWSILARPSNLQRAGVDLRGMHVVRKAPQPEERRLVVEVDRVPRPEAHSGQQQWQL